MTLILCGHQGVGKTTIGEALAQKRGQPFIDTDDLIKENLGCPLKDRLTDAHQRMGDAAFRELEQQILLSLKPKNTCVISIGGGALAHADAVAHLKHSGHVIYLKQSIAATKQQLLTKPVHWVKAMAEDGSLEGWLKQREQRYMDTAHYCLAIDHLSLNDTVTQCIHYGENHGQ